MLPCFPFNIGSKLLLLLHLPKDTVSVYRSQNCVEGTLTVLSYHSVCCLIHSVFSLKMSLYIN